MLWELFQYRLCRLEPSFVLFGLILAVLAGQCHCSTKPVGPFPALTSWIRRVNKPRSLVGSTLADALFAGGAMAGEGRAARRAKVGVAA